MFGSETVVATCCDGCRSRALLPSALRLLSVVAGAGRPLSVATAMASVAAGPVASVPVRPSTATANLVLASSAVDLIRYGPRLPSVLVVGEPLCFNAKENFVSTVFLMSKELCWLLGELRFPLML